MFVDVNVSLWFQTGNYEQYCEMYGKDIYSIINIYVYVDCVRLQTLTLCVHS